MISENCLKKPDMARKIDVPEKTPLSFGYY